MPKDKSLELADALISEFNCFKFQTEYRVCVDKYWKNRNKCDEMLKKLQVCLMKYNQNR